MDQTQLLKGVLDTAVLAVLRRGRTYGYDLVRQLRESGFEGVGDASVYGTLRRLFGAGYSDIGDRSLRGGSGPQVLRPERRRDRHVGTVDQSLDGFADTMNSLLQGEEEE